jgi:nucleotide-binding universal stress UspA family protein
VSPGLSSCFEKLVSYEEARPKEGKTAIFPTRILLATDSSEEAVLAAKSASDLANKTGSELHIVYVRPRIRPHYPGYYIGPEIVEGAEAREREHLDRAAQHLLDTQAEQIQAAGGRVTQSYLRVGKPEEEIVALAEELGARLIMLGSRGRGGVRRALMGSVSDSVVRHAHCPVMVVRGEPVAFPTKILVATDGSKDAEFAARSTVSFANMTDSEVHIVTVADDPYLATDYTLHFPEAAERHRREVRDEVQEMLNGQVERVEEAGGRVAQTHLRVGRADDQIVSLAEEMGAGLIVTGSRGQGSIKRALMGSVSSSVVYHAHCPVMVVRPQKERSAEDEAAFLT